MPDADPVDNLNDNGPNGCDRDPFTTIIKSNERELLSCS
ncbi:hypothetical protein ACVMII_005395 [Bradyrhizobium diazoefficiens]